MGALLLMASCTDDYKDWSEPQKYAQPETVSFGDGSVSSVSVINFADLAVDQELVKVCNINAPTASDELYAPVYSITIGEKTFALDNEGQMKVSDLVSYIESNFGKAPTQRDVEATVSMWLDNGGTSVKMATSAPFTISAIPDAPFIDPNGYYLVGNIDGWACKRVEDYHMTNNGGDVYANPTFSVTLPAIEGVDPYEVKIIPASAFADDGSIADWSIALSALPDNDVVANDGMISYNNAGGNIKFAADPNAKFYKISVNLMEGSYNVNAVSFSQFVYFIGATDGWSTPDQKVESPNFDGVYTGFLYIADPNGWGVEFKFQKRAGDWADDSQLNSNNLAEITGDFEKTGDNIKASAGEGVYFVELDLTKSSLKGTLVTTMSIIGDFNGWSGDAEMTWNATDFCYEVTNPGITANGWKFRVNKDWAINLGGKTLNDLVANGDNLSAVGNTVKLYPTRKTNDKIYCTVE